jgi:hypothetical protein
MPFLVLPFTLLAGALHFGCCRLCCIVFHTAPIAGTDCFGCCHPYPGAVMYLDATAQGWASHIAWCFLPPLVFFFPQGAFSTRAIRSPCSLCHPSSRLGRHRLWVGFTHIHRRATNPALPHSFPPLHGPQRSRLHHHLSPPSLHPPPAPKLPGPASFQSQPLFAHNILFQMVGSIVFVRVGHRARPPSSLDYPRECVRFPMLCRSPLAKHAPLLAHACAYYDDDDQ